MLCLNNVMKSRHLFIFLLISLLFLGCSKPRDLKTNCMKAAKIVKEASELLITTKMENVVEDGKIVATKVFSDNSKSKEYLKSKRESLQENYNIIKGHYMRGGEGSFDALCAMAVLNQFKIYLDGVPIDERCKYTVLVIDQRSKKMPSEWFLNEFYFYISRPPDFHDSNWSKMTTQDKFQDMINILLIPDENGKTCLDSGT